MEKVISGIQQLGIGIPNADQAFDWYRKTFGMDIKVFSDKATAELMLPYTSGKPKDRYAILSMNMKGGGGFEIWEPTSKKADKAPFELKLGDTGIFAGKVKCENISELYNDFKNKNVQILSNVDINPEGKKHFYIADPWGNIFELIEFSDWFKSEKSLTGGCGGCVIGVSDIDKALPVYKDILGYDQIIYRKEGVFKDLSGLPGGNEKYERVLLRHSRPRKGGFSRLIGFTEIELIKSLDRQPKKIFDNREWGDAGFIHLCHDVQGMEALKDECKAKGFPFTVDSADTFDMGEAAGRFSYIEDPDGTLLEFVETHKLPLVKSIGWSLNLQKRDPEKPLPNWILKAMKFNKVKG